MLINEITQPAMSGIEQQLYEAYTQDQWIPHEITESKKNRSQDNVPPPANTPAPVVFLKCALYQKTLEIQLQKHGDTLTKAIEAFEQLKTQDVNNRFGVKDRPLGRNRPLTQKVPNMGHCHLLHDSVLFYTTEGSTPKVIKLYAITTHDEAGIGQPPSQPRAQALGKQFGNQQF